MSDGGFDPGVGGGYYGSGPTSKAGILLYAVAAFVCGVAMLFVPDLRMLSLLFFGFAALFVLGFLIKRARGGFKK